MTLRHKALVAPAIVLGCALPATAQTCKRQGNDVTCDDGKRGIFTGDAIIRADARKPTSPREHPGVVIGNKSSVIVGHSVMVGSPGGKGLVPMENPSAQTRCPVLDGLAYCY